MMPSRMYETTCKTFFGVYTINEPSVPMCIAEAVGIGAVGTTVRYSTFTRLTFKIEKCGFEPCIACKHHP